MGAKRSLHDLVVHQLKDLYYAERHAAKILPKMAKAASSAALKAAFEERHDEMAAHVDRLETCFGSLDKKAHGIPCEAMDEIIAETKTMMDEFEDGEAIDAGLIAAAEAIEHYAIARYAALARWSTQMEMAEIVAPLETTLAEARQALDRWAALAGNVAMGDRVAATPPFTLKDAALMGLG